MEHDVPTVAPVPASIGVVVFTIIAIIMAYFTWFDYGKIPPFLGRMYPRGPINHQKIAESRIGELFYKLYSLIFLLFMGLILFAMLFPKWGG